MYVIRFQKNKYNQQFKHSLRLVVTKHGASTNSTKQVAILGYFNKKRNLLVLKFDLLLFWLSLGVNFSNSVYKLLSSTIKL